MHLLQTKQGLCLSIDKTITGIVFSPKYERKTPDHGSMPGQVFFYVSMEGTAIQYVNSNTEEGNRPQTQRLCLRSK